MELKKFYKVLSTNSDGTLEFVSTIEGRATVTNHCCWLGAALIKLSAAYSYPIYGTQWHPEKNPFEFLKAYIPHSPSAVRTTFYMAEFFVNEGREKPPLVAARRARRLLTCVLRSFVSSQPGRTNIVFSPRLKSKRRWFTTTVLFTRHQTAPLCRSTTSDWICSRSFSLGFYSHPTEWPLMVPLDFIWSNQRNVTKKLIYSVSRSPNSVS